MSTYYGKEDKKMPEGKQGIVQQWRDDAEGSRGTWESDITDWYKLRIREKKEKNYPFPGCSNIRLPTLDVKIKKLKSQIRNGVLGVRPVVQAVPTPGGNYETADKIEKFLDHLIMDKIGYESKFIITADQALEIGFFLNKPYWCLEIIDRKHKIDISDIPLEEARAILSEEANSEDLVDYFAEYLSIDKHKYVWVENYEALKKAVDKFIGGQFVVEVKTRDVVKNQPDVALIHPRKCYVRNDSGFDIQTHDNVVVEMWLSRNELEMMSINSGWDISKIDFTLESAEVNDELDAVKDSKEGIDSYNETGRIRVWEGQGYIDGKKQTVITAPDFSATLKECPILLPSGEYNLVKFFHELREDRWYHHRGLPEILEDLVKEIDVQHMQKIDRQTIVNSPMFLYRAGFINPGTTQFTFGQGIPVNGMQPLNDVFAPINQYNQAADFSYDREQQVLKSDIDEYTGQIDFTLSQQLNRREPRTAEEVQAQSSASAMVASLDLSIFRNSFEKLANMIWELWCEYGDDEYEFEYFGPSYKETIKLNKEEIQGKYKIKVRANDENTNPQTKAAKAQAILQAVMTPLAWQTGIMTPQNLFNAYKRYFQELGIPNAEELYTIPQPQEPGVPDKTMPKFEDLEEMEQAQVLTKLGIQPNVPQRVADKNREIRNQTTDNLVNITNSMK